MGCLGSTADYAGSARSRVARERDANRRVALDAHSNEFVAQE